MAHTTSRRRRAPLSPRVTHLLTTTSLSIAQVAARLKTNTRYVREIADRDGLPTNRYVSPSGNLALRIAQSTKGRGLIATRSRFRISAPKLKHILTTIR